jgi:pimeloyl-ACP methyl ester carboxylesterase
MEWREAGSGPALVLLHGIGSGAASWDAQLDALSTQFRVIAWNAPGYGGSSPLQQALPMAIDYAQALAHLLARLDVKEPTVVGHSLGALVAAAYAAQPEAQVKAMVLASPARGYGSASPEARQAKVNERVELVTRLGVRDMAEQRAAALCAPGASAHVIEQVRSNMAHVTPAGYAQAAHMLGHDDLTVHLRQSKTLRAVLCGELDKTTPPAACAQVARDMKVPFHLLLGVAHACYVEDAAQFNSTLLNCLHVAGRDHG